jgi:RimJ/RimL family protein N-acetyltransferase
VATLDHLPHLPALVEPVTDRIRMRAWRPEDRELFAALNADPEVMRFFPGLQSREESDEFADRIESRMAELGYGLWALEPVESGEFIGFTGLNPMPEDGPGAGGMEVGWRLARSAWDKGYATEAGRAALRVAFELAGFDEVWSLTAVVNEPSRAVMERLGLRHLATQPHPALDRNSPISEHVYYRITRSEFTGG